MTADPNSPPPTATALNELLRDMRRATPATPREPAAVDRTFAEKLFARWMLPERASVSDLPGLRALANVPLLGGLLAFVREGLLTLWMLLRRRSLVSQQIQFNKTVADGFIYLQALAETGLQLDREVQAWKSDVGELDHAVVALDADTRARAEALARRLDALEARLGALERALAASGAPPDRSP